MRHIIETDLAPKAIGPYSQAVKVGNTIYFSGQIPLDPTTMQIVAEDFKSQAEQVIKNLQAVSQAAGGDLNNIVKLTLYLTDLKDFQWMNEVMTKYFQLPYPARTTIQVAALPKAAKIEIEAIMVL